MRRITIDWCFVAKAFQNSGSWESWIRTVRTRIKEVGATFINMKSLLVNKDLRWIFAIVLWSTLSTSYYLFGMKARALKSGTLSRGFLNVDIKETVWRIPLQYEKICVFRRQTINTTIDNYFSNKFRREVFIKQLKCKWTTSTNIMFLLFGEIELQTRL